MNKNIDKLIEKIEGKPSISDSFIQQTENKELKPLDPKDYPQSWIKIHFKTYPRLPKIYLDNSSIKEGNAFALLKKRRSERKFTGEKISLQDLTYLLYGSAGITLLGESLDTSKRPYPSAGARYPLEIYPIILNCDNIPKGLYHYNVKENVLELLWKKNIDKQLLHIFGGEKWLTKAAIIFIITGVVNRTRVKYGDRGIKYVLIEAGHLAQNICLLATECNLGTCPLGGYIDESIKKLLDIELQKEYPFYILALGKYE